MQAQPKLLPRMNKIAVLDFFDQGIPTRVQESRKNFDARKLYGTFFQNLGMYAAVVAYVEIPNS